MDCPLCHAPMVTEQRPTSTGEVQVDHCRRCGSLFFDRGELAGVKGADDLLEQRLRLSARARVRCRYCGEGTEGLADHCGQPVRTRCPRCADALAMVDVRTARSPDGPFVDPTPDAGLPPERVGRTFDVCFGCGGLFLDGAWAAEALGEVLSVAERGARLRGELRPHVEPSAMNHLVSRAVSDLVS